jgi:transcriptional regulator with XRE-family HTH domain
MKQTERDKHAEMFADYVIEAMARTRMRQSEIARQAGLSRTTISQIVGKKPHSLTGKLLLPERETVDRIARVFGDPVSKARRAAGYLIEKEEEEKTESSEIATQKAQTERMADLIKNFGSLPPKEQQQILAIIQVLKSDHPELLNAPITIVDAKDLTDDDAAKDTDDTPP